MKKSLLYDRAVLLRQQGHSYKEIHTILSIAKSTASLWLNNIELSDDAVKRILMIRRIGREKGILSTRSKIAQTNNVIRQIAKERIEKFPINKNAAAIICSLLYWAEGSKRNGVRFTNSDPNMVAVFMKMFRNAFALDESRFHLRIHLHEYHDVEAQSKFWSGITDIPRKKIGIYLKPHTGISIRPGYPGCVHISYYDSRIFTQLRMIYNEFANQILFGGLV